MNYSNKHIFNFLLTMIVFAACKKSNFLETKPDQSLVVPTTLSELQGLLDNDVVMNGGGNFGVTPSLGEIQAPITTILKMMISIILRLFKETPTPGKRNCMLAKI